MDSLRICCLAMTAVVASVLLRRWSADFLPLIRLGAALLLCAAAISLISPLVSYLQNLTETAGIAPYAECLFKALAIAGLTQVCAELCRESGESGIATGVEIAGKAEILLLALPLVNEILSTANELLSLAA